MGDPEFDRSHCTRVRGRLAALVVGVLAGLLFLGPVVPAQASGGPEPKEARLLVLQSISLIANGADVTVVTERIGDALMAPDPAGTDLAMVRQALALLEGGVGGTQGDQALAQARELLTKAIDVRAATGYGEIPPPGQVGEGRPAFVTGVDSGTTVVLDELKPARGVRGIGGVVGLGVGLALLALGAYLARRWRPHSTIRELRRLSERAGES